VNYSSRPGTIAAFRTACECFAGATLAGVADLTLIRAGSSIALVANVMNVKTLLRAAKPCSL
jgi:hypothetical protein